MLRTIRQFNTLPQLPASGPMPPIVSVVLPLDRTNLITNPSIELATTGYTAVGGSIARSAAAQYHGTYSLAVTPSAGTNSDGAFYGTVSLTSGTPYAYSCKFKATGAGIGKTYALSVATTGGVDLAAVQFVATGRWQWIRGVYGETATNSRRIYIRKVNHSAASVFYIDGVQVESCADGILDATTYIDGDQLGLLVGQQPPPYLWTGTPHASTSSRSILTRAGGYLMNLQDAYGFLITAVIGLGMAAPNNVSVPYTVLDGARYLRTTKPQRTFSLPGRFQADDDYSLAVNQSDMRAALDRDLVPIQQPLVLVVEPQDECNTVIGDFAQIQCIYAGGLEGNETSLPVEDAAPAFTMYIPFLLGGEAGVALSVQQTVTNANAIAQRSPAGVWSALGTGMSGGTSVDALAYGLDGTLYAGGVFTDAGGSGADNIAKWDGSAWAVVKSATSINSTVSAIAVGPDGKIYVGGSFTNADGIAAADAIAVYDPNANTWAALSTGITGGGAAVLALGFAPDGTLYAGGNFTTAGGVAAANIAKWNGSAWSALGTGTNGAVNALAVAPNGTLYISGAFTTAGGVTVNRVASWNGSAWSAMASGLSGTSNALTIGPNGNVYASFNAGVGNAGVQQWNGTAWTTIGAANNSIFALRFDARGLLYAGGNFGTIGGITPADSAALWNGSAWLPLDVDFPGSPSVFAFVLRSDGTIVAGFNTTGSATTAVNTTATNTTPVYAYPQLVINGPSSGTSRIYQVIDYTTGYGIWFSLTISAGEVVTINADPQNPSYFSTFQGDITSKILPGSQPSLLYLAPGANSISFFAAASSVTATLSWKNRYNGSADLVN